MRIKDIALAPSGRDKIEWVKSYTPVLSIIEKEFKETKPFAGKKITMSIHLEAKTAYLAEILKAGGAEVSITGCNPLSTQDDVAAALAVAGLEVNAVHGATMKEYEEDLIAALSVCPDLIIDDGGDLIGLLHSSCAEYGKNLIGGCEETTTGIHRLKAREAAGALKYPMMDINDADCKHLFDNRYGTGQSVFDAIMHETNLIVAGKRVVIAGYGWCGKGAAMRAKGLGAIVYVTEIDPVKAIEAVMDGFIVLPMDQAAEVGDLFITLTGCKDVITGQHLEKMKDGVLLANAGHFDVEINKNDLEALAVSIAQRKPCVTGYTLADGRILNLLAEGRLVNLAAGNGHPAEIMDMSFALQAKGLEYLAKYGKTLDKKVYDVPRELDIEVATLKARALGAELDVLTPEQEAYLAAAE